MGWNDPGYWGNHEGCDCPGCVAVRIHVSDEEEEAMRELEERLRMEDHALRRGPEQFARRIQQRPDPSSGAQPSDPASPRAGSRSGLGAIGSDNDERQAA